VHIVLPTEKKLVSTRNCHAVSVN